MSLYQRIGGESAVRATVLKMYDKILDDEMLSSFFENVDVEALRRSQMAFVTYAFGGPNHYTGRSLKLSHSGAVAGGMNDAHFDRVALHLKQAMEELGVTPDLIAEALMIVESTRENVLGRSD